MKSKQNVSNLILVSFAQDHNLLFLKGIIRSLPNKYNEKLLEECNKPSEHNLTQICLETQLWISTKYYDAKVQVILLTYDFFLNANNIGQKIAILKENFNINILDGVFFLTKQIGLNNIQGLEQMMQISDLLIQHTSPNLSAIIYDRKKEDPVIQPFIEEKEKQLENFIEAIYEDLDNYERNLTNNQQKGLSEREESFGIQRVLEILECNIWSEQVIKEKVTFQEEKKDQEPQVLEQKQVNLMKPIFDDEEMKMDELAVLLQEMQQIRLSLLINNKRNTNFPDDKNDDSNRKQKAEDLINKLMKACNFEDLDDSDNEK